MVALTHNPGGADWNNGIAGENRTRGRSPWWLRVTTAEGFGSSGLPNKLLERPESILQGGSDQ
jgi:hypothetical protein